MAKCTIGGRKTIGILDGFIQYDQAHYLAKLQQKYPTCEQLNKAFPSLEMKENKGAFYNKDLATKPLLIKEN